MVIKISRRRFLSNYPEFPTTKYNGNQYLYPKTFASYIFTVDAKSTMGHCNNISKELTGLVSKLGYTGLNFLGDSTTPWLYRDHDYKPVKQALDYLIANKASKSFNGAFKVELSDLTEFSKNLFWLVRCNGVIFYPHFADPGFNIVGTICQYGNIHLSTLSKEADAVLNTSLADTKLKISDSNRC